MEVLINDLTAIYPTTGFILIAVGWVVMLFIMGFVFAFIVSFFEKPIEVETLKKIEKEYNRIHTLYPTCSKLEKVYKRFIKRKNNKVDHGGYVLNIMKEIEQKERKKKVKAEGEKYIKKIRKTVNK